MPYAPTVGRQDANFLFQGFENAGRAKIAGADAMASGIESAGKSIGGGIGDAMMKLDDHMAAMDNARGRIQAYTDAGMMSPKDASDILTYAGNNSDKLAGAMAAWEEKTRAAAASNNIAQQGANNAAIAQIKASRPLAPKYSTVVQPDGTVTLVSPNAPTIFPTDASGARIKSRQPPNPLAFLTGGAPGPDAASGTPSAPAPAPTPAPGGGAAPGQFREGMVVEQGGKQYRYAQGQFVPVN